MGMMIEALLWIRDGLIGTVKGMPVKDDIHRAGVDELFYTHFNARLDYVAVAADI